MKYGCLLLLLTTLILQPINVIAKIYPHETCVAQHLKSVEITETNSNFPMVDCIYAINLDARPEKWERTKAMFNQKGLRINRFSAVNGWAIPKKDRLKLVGNYPRDKLSGGQIGCLLSHVSILKDACERDFKIIWVVEDDVEFVEDISVLPDLIKELSEIDPDWDVFYTDLNGKNSKGQYVPSLDGDFRPDQDHLPLSEYLKRTAVSKNIMKIGQRFCTHSMIISRKGMEKLVHYYTHVYLWSAIDIDMHYIPGIRQYSAMRDIVSVKPDEISDTQAELKK